jgi:hypothetical protein
MLAMLKRALLVAGLGMSFTAVAQAERPDYRDDGSVRLGQKVFPNLAAYYASPEFQQSGARCGTADMPAIDPSAFAAADCSFTSTTINPLYNDNRVIVIQVVFHVIKKTNGMGDLTPALIQSQIDVLNEDFGAVMGTPGAPGTNTKVQFVLAKFAPNGQPTTGIEVVTNDSYFVDPGPGAANPMKTALRWDTTKYFNIYTNDAAGNLGYATFPQQDAGQIQDGVVLLWSSVGKNSLGGPPYNLGRTATHEVGHYFGLFHTFQGACGTAAAPFTTGDLISDTNREKAPHFGCTPAASQCTGGAGNDPIENYMDYSDDLCMNKFTPEQTNRLRCSIMSYRSVNTAPRAQFTFAATDGTVTFTNTSMDAESALGMLKSKWTFGDGMTSTDASPTHTYTTAGTYQVGLEIIDPGSGSSVAMQPVAVTIPPAMPDGGNPGGGDAGTGGGGGGDGTGCCQAPNGDVTFLLCGLPVALMLLRRRRRA